LAAQEFSRDSAEQRKSAEEIASRNRTAASQLLFVIKKHDATRLHYDLRLEWNWVLLSWALPEGLSYCPEHKREAIQVEDHAREHAGFEGMIPEGRRGAGTVMQWDVGTWEPRSGYTDVDAALRDGCLKFTMHGQKIKGNWTLTRISNKPGDEVRSYWLFSKDPDDYARAPHEVSILEEAPNSVLTNKTLEDIHRDWIKGKDKSKVQAKLF
jgi:bifunctional non-homologous end joining protein LigD